MNRAKIDLHMHTVYSDGASEPEALLDALHAAGIETAAITDHDTTAAYERLLPKAKELVMELIPAIEINTHWEKTEVHILGYYIDFECESLQNLVKNHRTHRKGQMAKMIERLWEVAKIRLNLEDVLGLSHPDGAVGRPHLAKAMMNKSAVKTISEAFNKYLKSDKATYVNRYTATPHEAVEAIYDSGGIPVIAHPGLVDKLEDLVPELLLYGLMGLEAYHKSHSPPVIEYICSLAEKHDLIITGGTDFHGEPDAYARAHERLVVPERVKDVLWKSYQGRQQAQFKVS